MVAAGASSATWVHAIGVGGGRAHRFETQPSLQCRWSLFSLRQAKPGKGGRGCRASLGNLSAGPCGYPIPPGQGWPPAGTACCVGVEQSRLRSVHRDRAGRVMEPRNKGVARADVVLKRAVAIRWSFVETVSGFGVPIMLD